MPDNLTNAEEDRLLDLSLSGAFVGLFTAVPGEAGGGTEVTGGSYARQALGATASSGGAAENDSEIAFPAATADWGTIVAVGLFSASSAGTLRWYRVLDVGEQRTVENGSQFVIGAGALTCSLS